MSYQMQELLGYTSGSSTFYKELAVAFSVLKLPQRSLATCSPTLQPQSLSAGHSTTATATPCYGEAADTSTCSFTSSISPSSQRQPIPCSQYECR